MVHKYAFKEMDNEKTAKAVGVGLDISTKHSKEVCDFIRGKPVELAIQMLEDVISEKRAVPYTRYKRDLAHKTKIGPGRYPKSTCKEVLFVLRSAVANAQQKGLSQSELHIKHTCAHLASRPWHAGRKRRRKMKRSHVEVVLEEVAKEKKKRQPREKKPTLKKEIKKEPEVKEAKEQKPVPKPNEKKVSEKKAATKSKEKAAEQKVDKKKETEKVAKK